MAKVVRLIGDGFLVLSGFLTGVLVSINGISRGMETENLNAIFLFPNVYYMFGIAFMAGLAVLLRLAARRLAVS